MKKTFKIMYILLILATMSILLLNVVNAANTTKMTQSELLNIIQNDTSIDTSNLNVADILNAYDELSKKYSNKEIATMIEENKLEVKKATGLSEDAITTGTDFLRNTSEEDLRNIINDLDINEIQSKLDQGYTTSEIIKDMLTPTKAAELGTKVLLANKNVQISLTVLAIETLFIIIVRWIIYKKAGRHGWAVLIPIYTNVTYLKVCGMSPWWLLLLLVPVVGWFIFAIVLLVSRFKLAEAFGRGFFFGLGLLFFRAIFELILAASSKPYIGEEE